MIKAFFAAAIIAAVPLFAQARPGVRRSFPGINAVDEGGDRAMERLIEKCAGEAYKGYVETALLRLAQPDTAGKFSRAGVDIRELTELLQTVKRRFNDMTLTHPVNSLEAHLCNKFGYRAWTDTAKTPPAVYLCDKAFAEREDWLSDTIFHESIHFATLSGDECFVTRNQMAAEIISGHMPFINAYVDQPFVNKVNPYGTGEMCDLKGYVRDLLKAAGW